MKTFASKKFWQILKKGAFIYLILFLILSADIFAQTILVDFGDSAENNEFEMAGWNTLIKSPDVDYSSNTAAGLVPGPSVGEYDDYQGVSGTPRKFSAGERVVVVWHNLSDETISVSARISFTDADNPNEDGSGGKWYTMRSFNDYRFTYQQVPPHSMFRTVFNIEDSGVHKTDETYSLINVNLHCEWFDTAPKPNIMCDLIQLYYDADIEPPTAPLNLQADAKSYEYIQLYWDNAADNIGVVEYLIYRNDEVVGYCRSSIFNLFILNPSTEYNFTVTALDAAGNESPHSNAATCGTWVLDDSYIILPSQFEYAGAFRLPEDYSYGGEAIAYNPNGDGGQTGTGSADGFAGSLFVTDLNQVERGFVGEVSIPEPVISPSKNLDDLNEITTLQNPGNIRPANVQSWDFVDIWRTGLEYIPDENRLYSSWSIHYTVTGDKHASISACDASSLSGSEKLGAWYVGNSAEAPNDAMANDFLFDLPHEWASEHAYNRELVTGRCRDGGLSGLGPTLYAMPLLDNITPPAANSPLEITTLLQYGPVEGTDNYNYPNSLNNYNHADAWRDADFISTKEGRGCVIFAGNKARGNNWYGYQGENMRHDWVIADLPYPDFWETDPDGKGWRANSYEPMFMLYGIQSFEFVTNGIINPYDPQPYCGISIDKNIFWGSRHEISSASYDPINQRLYVTEYNAPADGRLLIHVWNINDALVSVDEQEIKPFEFRLEQNYPNPFNPMTNIKYVIPHPGPAEINLKDFPSYGNSRNPRDKNLNVSLKVYDVLGREVATLVNTVQSSGSYEVQFDGSKYSSGVYFYRLTAGEFQSTKKMALTK